MASGIKQGRVLTCKSRVKVIMNSVTVQITPHLVHHQENTCNLAT